MGGFMLDVSKETNLGFLRYSHKYLQEKVLLLEKQVLELKLLQKRDEELCKTLSDELLVLKMKFFKGGSERHDESPKKNRRRKSQNEMIVHNHRPVNELPDPVAEMDSEEVVHTLAASTDEDGKANVCTACTGGEYLPMKSAFEESTEIHVTERKYVLRRHKRQKYCCTQCKKIVAAPSPAKLTSGGQFSIHMAATVVDDKFHRHLPLNRQAEMMAERGLKVDTKTLFSLTEHLMHLLGRVNERIKREVLQGSHVHIDESPFSLKYPETNGYVWSISNPCGVFYQYETTRSGAVARELLSGYQGIVMADAYQGYDYLEKIPGIIFVLCWAHVRRKFVEAETTYPKAGEVIDLIDKLYDIEHEAKDFAELASLREQKSTPVARAIFQWIEEQKGKYLESLTIGKAISYAVEHRTRLSRFLSNAKIPIDNNAGERSQRQPVMGRNNFQGFRTINGSDVGVYFYTIISTCKLLTLNPKVYLIEMGLRSARGERILTPLEYAREIDAKLKLGLTAELIYQSALQ
jgi:transposase